jgi:hypothetical protein
VVDVRDDGEVADVLSIGHVWRCGNGGRTPAAAHRARARLPGSGGDNGGILWRVIPVSGG